MYEEVAKEYGELSNKTKKRIEEMEKVKERLGVEIYIKAESSYERKRSIEELQYVVAERDLPIFQNYLLDSLGNAVVKTVEYNRAITQEDLATEGDKEYDEESSGSTDVTGKPFWDRLVEIIKVNAGEIVIGIIEGGITGIYEVMEDIAGGDIDFWEGIQYARTQLDVSGKNRARAADFWKNIVWPNNKLYSNTVSLRFDSWGELAPYWVWLEHGNQGTTAYPQFSATYFLYNASAFIQAKLRDNATRLYEESMKEDASGLQDEIKEIQEDFETKAMNLFEDAQKKFLEHPEQYQPGDIIARLTDLENARDIKIVVTEKKRQIGSRFITRRRKRP